MESVYNEVACCACGFWAAEHRQQNDNSRMTQIRILIKILLTGNTLELARLMVRKVLYSLD
jgi:hypothetical protein